MKKFKDKIWLSTPTMHGDEIRYVQKAYDTNWLTTIGENIDEIEKNVCQKIGCKHAVALATGTAALHMAVKLADVQKGEKVFCSDMTFVASANPVVYEGGTPVFIDAEYDSWNMDPVALEKAFELYPDVKVVIYTHLYGIPGKIDEIAKICKEHNAILIEDAAEAFGAKHKGQYVGTFGDIGIFSFNGNKIITGSSGGMLISHKKEYVDQVHKWSTQSKEDVIWYEHKELGYNYRISNVIAGIIRGQLPYLEDHIARKKEIYNRYKEGLKDVPVTMNPYDEVDSQPNFWLSCLVINSDIFCHVEKHGYIKHSGQVSPEYIYKALGKINIESRPTWKPMHMQPLYKNNLFITRDGAWDTNQTKNKRNVSWDIFRRGLCLPSDIKMTNEQQDFIIETIKDCFK